MRGMRCRLEYLWLVAVVALGLHRWSLVRHRVRIRGAVAAAVVVAVAARLVVPTWFVGTVGSLVTFG